jgi:hypothetical protein
VDLIGEYVEGTLPPEKAKALEDHLSYCPPCITFLRTYKATRGLCRKAMAREMPAELMNSLQTFLGKHIAGFGCSSSESASATAKETPVGDAAPKKV